MRKPPTKPALSIAKPTLGEVLELLNPGGGFSHQEMLRVTGLPQTTLHTWYKRHHLPAGFIQSPGYGNRRRYHFSQLCFLTAARHLADMGIPVVDTMKLAAAIGGNAFGFVAEYSELSPEDAYNALFNDTAYFWSVFKIPAGCTVDLIGGVVASEFAALMNLDSDTLPQLHEWCRKMRRVTFNLVDATTLAIEVLSATARVIQARGASVERNGGLAA